MSVNLAVSNDGDEVLIRINGRFDYEQHDEFRSALDMAQSGQGRRYIIDMGGVDDMDSSALGMLLLLRESAGGDASDIEIKKCRPDVRDVLAIANFEKLFKVS